MCIQVENVPGIIDGYWYNPYFEIPFEDRRIWAVEDLRFGEDGSQRMGIVVEAYADFRKNPNDKVTHTFETWEEFIFQFNYARMSYDEGVFS